VLYTTNLRGRNTDGGLDANANSPDGAPEIKERATRMTDQGTKTTNDNSHSKDEGGESSREPTREEESGEASEPDAPTSGEENAGMSTILDGGLGAGVQNDADDE
jgi:hypothetical protein